MLLHQKWTQDYKEFLETMLVGDSKKPAELKDLRENHTETTVSFTLIADKEKIDEFEQSKGGLFTKFKLSGSLTTSNMTLFDETGRIVRFDTPLHIMEAFYNIRLDYYAKRKANLIRNLEAEKLMLSNKARFVEEVCEGILIVSNRKRKELLLELKQREYSVIIKEAKKKKEDEDESDGEDVVDDAPTIAELAKGYEYLLGMKIWSLTYEKAEQLRSQLEMKAKELDELMSTPPSSIWLKDLDVIDAALDERDVIAKADAADEQRAQNKNKTRQAKITKKKAITKKKKADWDSEMETDSENLEIANESEDDFLNSHSHGATNNARKRVAEKRQPVKAASPSAKLSRDLEDDNILLSQMDQLIVSPPIKKRVSEESKKESCAGNIFGSESDSDSSVEIVLPIKKGKAVKSKPVSAKQPKKVANKKVESSSGTSNTGRKAAAKTKVAKKKVIEIEESDDESEDFEFRVEESTVPMPVRAKRTAAVAAKEKVKPTYTFSDDESENDSDF